MSFQTHAIEKWGPKFFEVNFAFLESWRFPIALYNVHVIHTVWYNYNGKTPTFRKIQNSPQKNFVAPFLDSVRLK